MLNANRDYIASGVTDDANKTVSKLRCDPVTNRIKIKVGSSGGTSVPLIEYLKDPNRVPCSAAVADNILQTVSVLKCDSNGYIKVKFI